MNSPTESRTDRGCWWSILGLATLALCCTDTLYAQSLGFRSSAAYLQGVRPAVVQVMFNAGDASIQQYTMAFTYPPSMLEPPTMLPCIAAAQCTVDPATHTVNVFRSQSEEGALVSEIACMIEFSAFANANPGFALLSVTSSQFIGAEGMPVAGTSHDSSVVVVPGESSPVWQFNPAADTDCRSDSHIELSIAPTPAQSTLLAVQALGSAVGAQPVAISCGVSQGFTLISGGEQNVGGNGQPMPLEMSCAADSGTTGTLTCLEGSSAGEIFYLWDLVCADSLFADGFEGVN